MAANGIVALFFIELHVAAHNYTLVHKIAGLHEIAGHGGKGIILLFCVYLIEESVNSKYLNRDSR
jgi:hypothetical protein